MTNEKVFMFVGRGTKLDTTVKVNYHMSHMYNRFGSKLIKTQITKTPQRWNGYIENSSCSLM
jgi:hypothetical protein